MQTESRGVGLLAGQHGYAEKRKTAVRADGSQGGGQVHVDRRFASPSSADTLPDRYLFDTGEPLPLNEAAERYRNHRLGEEASTEINGFRGSLHRRARRKCALIHHADRRFRAQEGDPSLLLLTLAGSWNPTHDEYGPLLDYELAVAETLDSIWSTVRYRLLRGREAEYVLIEAGTEQGVPHWHLLIWTEGDEDTLRANAEEVLRRFQSALPDELREFDPSEGASVPDGAILIDTDPNTELKSYPADGDSGPVHAFARYVANQLPHLGLADRDVDTFEGMTAGEARYGVLADASPTVGWRASHAVSRGDQASTSSTEDCQKYTRTERRTSENSGLPSPKRSTLHREEETEYGAVSNTRSTAEGRAGPASHGCFSTPKFARSSPGVVSPKPSGNRCHAGPVRPDVPPYPVEPHTVSVHSQREA